MVAILQGYGVGPQVIRLLEGYWEGQKLAARAGGFHGDTFTADLGATQGDPMSSTIYWSTQVCGRRTVKQGLGVEINQKGISSTQMTDGCQRWMGSGSRTATMTW